MRLTDRDRQLCGLLSQARWLTKQQLMRVAFPGRHQRDVQKRMAELSSAQGSGWGALLRRHRWVTLDGVHVVWGLTEAGYAEAGNLLDVDVSMPSDEFAPETMAHHVALTELFVGLLARPLELQLSRLPARLTCTQRKQALAGLFARAHQPAWRWTVVGDGVKLPWTAYEGGRSRAKLQRPDAVLELVTSRRRLFLECELGTHTVVDARADKKPNSAMAKLSRWNTYVTVVADGHSRRTWYQQRYPDGYAPEVLFLVHSERRARSVAGAIEAWHQGKGGLAGLTARALTMEQALTELSPLVTEAGASQPEGKSRPLVGGAADERVHLSPEEARAVVRFFLSAREDLKRRQAIAVPGRLPVVPESYEAMKALTNRLQEREGR